VTWRGSRYRTSTRRSPPDARCRLRSGGTQISDALVDELFAAEVIVIAAPMHNFGVPSSLKAWIDHIVRPGRTFTYSEKGPQGLMTGKKAVLVLARGGVYSEGPMQAFDFQEPYLRAALGFIGITDVEVIRVEGVAFGEEAVSQALRSADARATAIVRRIVAQVADDVRVAA
jgi:FMN-dependent NADH-azoreductase